MAPTSTRRIAKPLPPWRVRLRIASSTRAQAACKPGSVPGTNAGGWPFLWDPVSPRASLATDPDDRPGNQPAPTFSLERLGRRPTWSCSRWGRPYRQRCRADAVRSCRTRFHPYHQQQANQKPTPAERSALCGTPPGSRPAGCYPAPCSRGARGFPPPPHRRERPIRPSAHPEPTA